MKWPILILLLITFSGVLKAKDLSDNSSEKEINDNIAFAKNFMINVLKKNSLKTDAISTEDLNLFSQYRNVFLNELTRSPIKIQSSDQSFVHFSHNTWIETDIKPNGEIRLTNLQELILKPNLGPQLFIHFFAHEIGHHILSKETQDVTPEIESRAWQIATAYENVFTAQALAPQLLQLKIGSLFPSKQGCHDEFKIKEVDALTGLVRGEFSTSKSHCRILESYMKWWYKTHSFLEFINLKENSGLNYIYDKIELTFRCKMNQREQLVCADEKPTRLFKICPSYLESGYFKSEENVSSIFIESNSLIHTNIQWCVSGGINAIGFIIENKSYSPNNQPGPLTDLEMERDAQLNRSLSSMNFYILKTIKSNSSSELQEVE
jgi:hypothetical protein